MFIKRTFNLLIIAGIFIVFTNVSPCAAQSRELVMAVEVWPPRIINAENGSYTGIDVDIAQELAKRMNLKLTYIEAPWARCLMMMKKGKADILTSLLRRPEREEYMYYIEPPYIKRSSKVFYVKKGWGKTIKKYEDLYGLDIGVLRKARYFDPFDSDKKINKIGGGAPEQLLKMVLKERIDAFVGTEMQEDYLIRSNDGFRGKFEKCEFRYDKEVLVYLALSKKSPHVNRLYQFGKIMKELIESGQVDSIIKKYAMNFPEYHKITDPEYAHTPLQLSE